MRQNMHMPAKKIRKDPTTNTKQSFELLLRLDIIRSPACILFLKRSDVDCAVTVGVESGDVRGYVIFVAFVCVLLTSKPCFDCNSKLWSASSWHCWSSGEHIEADIGFTAWVQRNATKRNAMRDTMIVEHEKTGGR
mmetsp:Transcript_58241/g.104257  ORF Transcript_58241/g.104257 Transcript_58241/m.104257 type:complete len:136 (-) Transcript_58241:24-431(-)